MKKGNYTPWIVLIYNTIQWFHQRKVFPKFGENQSKISVANTHIQYMNLHVIYSLLQNRSPVVLLRCDRLSQVHKLWLPETSTESSSTVRILWPNGSIDSIIIQKLYTIHNYITTNVQWTHLHQMIFHLVCWLKSDYN